MTGNVQRAIPADFEADVRLTGDGVAPGPKALGTLAVGGTIRGSAIEVNGNVGSVKARAFVDSSLLLGLDGMMLTGRQTRVVHGQRAARARPTRRSWTADVTADRIGTVTLKSVGTTPPGRAVRGDGRA